MAIARMAKVMIVSHRSQSVELLEALQSEGICQILNAEEAAVVKDLPELAVSAERPRDVEGLLVRLERSAAFLKVYATVPKGLTSVLAPRTVIDKQAYDNVVSDVQIPSLVEKCGQLEASMEKTKGLTESLQSTLDMLKPWSAMKSPVEELGMLHSATCWTGLLPAQHFDQAIEKMSELGVVVQKVSSTSNKHACIIVALNENADDAQKILRSVGFEAVSFEGMNGTVAELTKEHSKSLDHAQKQLQDQRADAVVLSKNLLKLRILCDHYQNLLKREVTMGSAPATEQAVILEGWVKQHDYSRLEKLVSGFDASSLVKTKPAEGEEIPVEIENKSVVRPFEAVTRLYGMPQYLNIDPTALLMPFFAIFFGMCIADAGYGLLMIALAAFLVKKMQGDKKLLMMLGICAVATVFVGALTGGWFGDAIQKFVPALAPVRSKMIWFDPFQQPLLFFGLAIGLGYFQLITGLVIAFIHNLIHKDYIAAACDQLTWIVMLNSIVLFGASKAGVIPAWLGTVFGYMAIIPAIAIFLFSHREGGWGGRLGMGFYNVFSTVFYLGDVLSYLRLMALGMVGAGLAMAINVIAEIAGNIPVIGFIVTIVILIGGHVFNMLLAVLSAFVHTLRLQYVEFFPKFLVGGGREFQPLTKEYKHIYMDTSK